MDHLSSCYFCGAALDKRLQEYPVVPEQLRDSEDVTMATLCPACHQKLETIFEAIPSVSGGEAPETDTVSGTTSEDGDAGGPESDTVAGPDPAADDGPLIEDATLDGGGGNSEADDGEHDDRPDSKDRSEPSNDTEPANEDAVTADDVADMAGDIDPDILDDGDDSGEDDDLRPAMQADASDAFGGTDGDETAESGTVGEPDVGDPLDTGGSDDGGDEELASAMEAEMPSEFQSDDDTATGTDPTGDADTPTGSDDGPDDAASDESPTASTDEEETAATARTSISALEYNKVMRLLQNREFPVGREEIETVAASAYDLSRAECAEVIDLAVDRGLVGEDGDRLVRPD